MQEKKHTKLPLYQRVRKMLLSGILLALLLSLGASFALNMIQESRTREQTLSSAVQMAANSPILMADINQARSGDYIQRAVVNVSSLDLFAVYDKDGQPVAFYDLATGADDPALLSPLGSYVIEWFRNSREVLFYDSEAPSGADTCAYLALYSDTTGEHIGYAMAGIYVQSIRTTVFRMISFHLLAGIVALGAGSFLSLRLSRNIKEKLLGYEPDTFRTMFLQRMDIVDALDEGLLAIDANSQVSYLNQAASQILQIDQVKAVGRSLSEVYPQSTIPRVMRTTKAEYNISLKSITHVSVISDRLPLLNEGKVEGAIAIFRNRTEVTKLAQDLTGVQHIIEALRANTHEFTNKLHVILGLLQLGETEKAEEYVQQITETRTQSIGYVADRIKDSSVAALLIGKAYRAAELGITFTLDPASALQGSGQFLPLSGLITVLGNLIENAFDALQGAPSDVPSEVTVSIREGARGLLLSVDDTGPGMTQEVQQHIFERGFSTKGEGRGTGLSLVKDTLDAYNGTIRVESEPGVGTSFIITLNDRSQP